jgi:transcriptional regulator with XRE-family HTH domain
MATLSGLLVYNETTSSLDVADGATRAYIDSQISSLVDGSPETLDTLNELAAALNDDPAYFTNAEAARQANTNLINAETARATAAEAAIQSDVDQNEADADAAIAAVQADVDQNEADADAAIAALQADVDQNEADADAAIAAVQADVDQNEADADAAIAAVQADVDQNEADADAAIAALQADVDQNEQDADNAIAAETARALAAEQVIQNDVDANETAINASLAAETAARIADVDAEEARALAAEALLAPLASPVLTGTPQAPTATAGTSTTQLATTAYVQTAVANLVDNAPGTLDTLNEIATALGNDANLSTTLTNSITAVQADVDQNELDSDTADAALGVRIDNVEAEIDTARTNIYTALGRTEGVQAMGTFTGSTLADNDTVKNLLQALETATEGEITARTAIAEFASNLTKLKNDLRGTYINVGNNIELRPAPGGRVEIVGDLYLDNNTAIDGAGTTLTSFANINAYDGRLNVLEADPTTAAAVAAVQADVDQNEADADAAIAAVQADVDQNEADADAAIAAVQADVDQNESDADAAIAAVQADVDQNESDSDAADAAIVDGTTNFTGFQLAGTQVTATGAELNYLDVTSAGTADASKALVVDGTKSISGINTLTVQNLNVQGTTTTVDTVTMQASNAIQFEGLTADANETVLSIVDPTADQTVYLPNQSGYLPVLAAASTTQITATPEELNYCDGVTSNIQTQLNAIQADVDQNESDADAAIAAVQADVDQNEADADAAIAAVQADVDQNEADADAAIALKLDASAVSAFGGTLIDDADAATARTTLGVDAAGTDNSTDVTIAAGRDYVTLTGQELTLGAVDLTTDVTGALPVANGGTGATDVAGAKAALDVDHLITLSGVAAAADDLGTFTGATINDNVTVKAALQALETAQEATQADVDTNEADADAAIAAILAGTSIPGPYNNDAAAATGGVAVGAIYKNTNGTIHWRVS